MDGRDVGSEALELPEEIQDGLSQYSDARADGTYGGLFSPDELRYLFGIKEFDEGEDGRNNRGSKRNAVRNRIRNGITDLAVSAMLLPQEEWETIVGGHSSIPFRDVAQSSSDDFDGLIIALAMILATIDFATDRVSEDEDVVDDADSLRLEISDYLRRLDEETQGPTSGEAPSGTVPSSGHTGLPQFWELYTQFRVGRLSRQQLIARLMESNTSESD
jgi:hypothetical protein